MKTIRTNKMPLRLLMLVVGAYIMGLGVALSIRSALGTTPVSSVPYVLSLAVPGLSVGTFTILMNVLFVFAQWLILREGFGKRHLLQIPAVVLYGLFTDLNLWLLSGCLPDHYAYKLLLALLSCAVMAVGRKQSGRANRDKEINGHPAFTSSYNAPQCLAVGWVIREGRWVLS